jgi:hypothetical protein
MNHMRWGLQSQVNPDPASVRGIRGKTHHLAAKPGYFQRRLWRVRSRHLVRLPGCFFVALPPSRHVSCSGGRGAEARRSQCCLGSVSGSCVHRVRPNARNLTALTVNRSTRTLRHAANREFLGAAATTSAARTDTSTRAGRWCSCERGGRAVSAHRRLRGRGCLCDVWEM